MTVLKTGGVEQRYEEKTSFFFFFFGNRKNVADSRTGNAAHLPGSIRYKEYKTTTPTVAVPNHHWLLWASKVCVMRTYKLCQ